jgi:hypothetical protein
MAVDEELGDPRGVGVSQGKLAQILIATGRRDEGCAMLREAGAALRAMGAASEAATVEKMLAELCGEGRPPGQS